MIIIKVFNRQKIEIYKNKIPKKLIKLSYK